MAAKVCYCCSGLAFDVCCKPFIDGIHTPKTAEALMRSRYSAYATLAVDYIIQTTHASTRKQYNAKSIREWAESSTWLKLEVLHAEGKESDLSGKVEFKAYFKDVDGINHVHHEFSNFVKENNFWFFVTGIVF